MPLVLIAALALPSLIAMGLGLCFFGGIRNYPNYKEIVAKFDSSMMLVLFLIYPSLSATVVRAFSCRNYGVDGRFLADDHTVDCDSPEYQQMRIWAIVCVVLYPFGIPAFYYSQMVWAGLPKLLAAKESEARFASLLQLRRRQLSTMPRAICAQVRVCGWAVETHGKVDDL
jgi:hypothetical protein